MHRPTRLPLRRLSSFGFAVVLAAGLAQACGGARDEPAGAHERALAKDEARAAEAPPSPAAEPMAAREEVAAAADMAAPAGAAPPAPPAMRAKGEEGSSGAAKPKIAAEEKEEDAGRYDPTIQSGLLTAGAFDDNANPAVLRRFLGDFARHPELGAFAAAMLGHTTIVTVRDDKGQPLGDATVTFSAATGQGKALRTRSDGRVIHVAPWDGEAPTKIAVEKGAAKIQREVSAQMDATEIILPGTSAQRPQGLDVALVIDATGSMGDELEYLKVELRGIAEAIARDNPQVTQRYALIVYRDTTDDYVTRVSPFTESLDRFIADLGAQSAGGGGDYPEAMDRALVDASELEWRSGDVARIAFVVADAPPHAQDYRRTFDAVDALRGRGVSIYPIAASGVAGEAEVVMRIGAALSGALYIWLTDDSGVGAGHAEPHIPCYFVQRLSQVMMRAVRDELAGARTDPDPSAVIRTVGRPKAGICVTQ